MVQFFNRPVLDIVLILSFLCLALIILTYVVINILKKSGLKSKWVSLTGSDVRTNHADCPLSGDIPVMLSLTKNITKEIAKRWYKEKMQEQMEAVESNFVKAFNVYKDLARDFFKYNNNYKYKELIESLIELIILEIKNTLKITIEHNNFPTDIDSWTAFKKQHTSILTSGVINKLYDKIQPIGIDEYKKFETDVIIPFIDEMKFSIDKSLNEAKNTSNLVSRKIKRIERDYEKNIYKLIYKREIDYEKIGLNFNDSSDK